MHYAALLVQYMVLNSFDIDYNWLIKMLRAVAMAWGPGTTEYTETMAIINMIKEEAHSHTLTAARAWLLVKGVLPNAKHVTTEINNFMDNMEINGCLSEKIKIDEPEDTDDFLLGKYR